MNTMEIYNKQKAILKNLFKNCNPKTYVDTPTSGLGNAQIKHFNLPDNTQVYSIRKPHFSRLISATPCENVSYIETPGAKTLLPTNELEKTTGAFIHVNEDNFSYTLYNNGKVLCNCGFNFDIDNPNNITPFLTILGEEFEFPEDANSLLEILQNKQEEIISKVQQARVTSEVKLPFEDQTSPKALEREKQNLAIKIRNMIGQLSAIESKELDKFIPETEIPKTISNSESFADLLESLKQIVPDNKIVDFSSGKPIDIASNNEVAKEAAEIVTPEISTASIEGSTENIKPDVISSKEQFIPQELTILPKQGPIIKLINFFKSKFSRKVKPTTQIEPSNDRTTDLKDTYRVSPKDLSNIPNVNNSTIDIKNNEIIK